jgi:hypothetical protein
VERHEQTGEPVFPSFESFSSSIEPLPTSFLFEKKRWQKLYQFTEVGVDLKAYLIFLFWQAP